MASRQYTLSTRTGDVNESNYWGIFRLCMRFLHNNRILAPDDKINTQSQCIGAVVVYVCNILHWADFLDTIWGISTFVPDDFVQRHYIAVQQHYIVSNCRKYGA